MNWIYKLNKYIVSPRVAQKKIKKKHFLIRTPSYIKIKPFRAINPPKKAVTTKAINIIVPIAQVNVLGALYDP